MRGSQYRAARSLGTLFQVCAKQVDDGNSRAVKDIRERTTGKPEVIQDKAAICNYRMVLELGNA